MTVFTIGYEGLSIDKFTSLLATHNIETVVDIRELPLSRKPGFSKKALANLLNLSGFEYTHMVELGCPRPVRQRYREDGDWKRYTAGFLTYLATQRAAIVELSALALSSNCVLLCYEADFNFCHRSMVADAVRENCNADIKHITAAGAGTTSPADPQLAFA